MGTSRTPKELARKLDRWADGIARQNRTAVEQAALAVKETTVPLIRQATGGDMRLSGVGRKGGAKIGVRYDVKGNERAVAIVKATGPAHLAERDVKPHVVVSRYAPKKFGRSRARRGASANAAAAFNALAGRGGASGGFGWNRRAVIRFGNVVARYAINSGGSKGRKPYERGFSRGAEIAPKVYLKTQRQVGLGIFR